MKNVVTIGGGTGTFVVLSGLKKLPNLSLSAVVTTADDGGSTGHLRDAYGFLPAGDARQALVALAEEGTVLRELFAYRFTKSDIAGHNLGNLFITALTDILGSDTKAIEEASKILRVHGVVLPATDGPAVLVAVLEDGTEVRQERAVDEKLYGRSPIRELRYETPLPLSSEAHRAILEADVIIIGPGDLYTSSVAALLPDGMVDAIVASKAHLVYIANLFTKAGQTDGYTLKEHVAEITRYAGRAPDTVLIHSDSFDTEVLAWYASEFEYPVEDTLGADVNAIRVPLAGVKVVPSVPNDPIRRSLMRHDPDLVAGALLPLLQ